MGIIAVIINNAKAEAIVMTSKTTATTTATRTQTTTATTTTGCDHKMHFTYVLLWFLVSLWLVVSLQSRSARREQ